MAEKDSVFFTNLSDLRSSLSDNNEQKYKLDLHDDEDDFFVEDYEGQLSVDVFDKGTDIVVKSTIAGVRPEDLDISIHDDLLTIRGKRTLDQEVEEKNYYYRECYWGGFSRSIILPEEVQADKIEAGLKNGVLTIILPKANKTKVINIKVEKD